MPIEIKEFSIKVNASNTDKAGSQTPKEAKTTVNKEVIINECLEQVFELLSNKKER